jgi:cytochrome b subunit of formate dehydrogenase
MTSKLGRIHSRLSELTLQPRFTCMFSRASQSGTSVTFSFSLQWSHLTVVASLILAALSGVSFLLIELFVAPEPVMAPVLLKQKIPLLVGASNFLVAVCNFSISYFFPMWFQTVMQTSASMAGGHLAWYTEFTSNRALQDCTCYRIV